jgi:hypothetical protein
MCHCVFSGARAGLAHNITNFNKTYNDDNRSNISNISMLSVTTHYHG